MTIQCECGVRLDRATIGPSGSLMHSTSIQADARSRELFGGGVPLHKVKASDVAAIKGERSAHLPLQSTTGEVDHPVEYRCDCGRHHQIGRDRLTAAVRSHQEREYRSPLVVGIDV